MYQCIHTKYTRRSYSLNVSHKQIQFHVLNSKFKHARFIISSDKLCGNRFDDSIQVGCYQIDSNMKPSDCSLISSKKLKGWVDFFKISSISVTVIPERNSGFYDHLTKVLQKARSCLIRRLENCVSSAVLGIYTLYPLYREFDQRPMLHTLLWTLPVFDFSSTAVKMR